MAALIFFFRGKLRECFLERREIEHGIVAESSRSARRLEDFSVNAIRDDGHGASACRQRDRANEISNALGSCLTSHLAQELFNPLRIRRLRPGISCGMNPGSTAESRHDQSRVIGEDQAVPMPRVVQRLACRIFGECRSVLLERGKRIETRQQCQFNGEGSRGRRRERAILGELPRIR